MSGQQSQASSTRRTPFEVGLKKTLRLNRDKCRCAPFFAYDRYRDSNVVEFQLQLEFPNCRRGVLRHRGLLPEVHLGRRISRDRYKKGGSTSRVSLPAVYGRRASAT